MEVLGARVNLTGPVSLGKERGVCAKVNRQPLRGLELWEHDQIHPKKGQLCLRVENGWRCAAWKLEEILQGMRAEMLGCLEPVDGVP